MSFADAPQAHSFRAESERESREENVPPDPHGDVYTGVENDSHFETNIANPDARIWEIWVTPPL